MLNSTAMNTTASDAFLSGQGVPVGLDEVESELVHLWGPSAERVGGPALENPNVTRVALANLVVARLSQDGPGVASALDAVVARRPSRSIVLLRSDDPERKVSAEVSASCYLPAPGLPQVCSERIVLSAGEPAFDLLPGAVRPLLETDLPMALWWVGDPRAARGVFEPLATEAGRLLIDLPDPDSDIEALRYALDLDRLPHARDLAWSGLGRWRELVAQFFDPPGSAESARRIRSVEIESETTSGAVPRASAWLAGWLAGQLGWNPVETSRPSAGRVEARFEGPGGPVSVVLQARSEASAAMPRIRSVCLEASGAGEDGSETFALRRLDSALSCVQIETCSATRCALPRIVEAPETDQAQRVAGALESARDDPPYEHALPVLLWLMTP
jgi:glucose-6-phosphate dehydrogenase assembly protein OpcA